MNACGYFCMYDILILYETRDLTLQRVASSASTRFSSVLQKSVIVGKIPRRIYRYDVIQLMNN